MGILFIIRGAGDSPFFFFFVEAWLGLCYHFFALVCFHPLNVAYLKKKCFVPLCRHLLFVAVLIRFCFLLSALCWYILSGAKLVTFSVRHQGYTSFVVRVATFVASSRFIYISLDYFTKKIFLFLLPFGAYSPSHAQSILPSVKYSPSQVQSILRRKRVLFFKNLVVTLPEHL